MNAKIYFLLILLLASIVSISYADDFSIKYTAVDDMININEEAVYNLEITNFDDKEAKFLIYPGSVEWDIVADPFEDNRKTIGPLETATIVLKLKPSLSLISNYYGVPIKVKNLETSEVITKEVVVGIEGDSTQIDGKYLPAIKSEILINKEISPDKPFIVTVILKNQNTLNLSKLSINLKSDLFQKEYETTLNSKEVKELSIPIEIDPLTNPTNSTLNIDFIIQHENELFQFKARTKEFEIISYGEIETSEDIQKSFLRKDYSVELSNTGNIPREYIYIKKKTLFNSIFLNSFPKPDSVEEISGEKVYVWRGTLAKEGKYIIQIKESYRLLFIILMFATLSVLGYYFFRSPVIIIKTARAIEQSDGGITEVAVQIHLKNRSKRIIRDIEIRDKVQNLLEIKQDFSIGTLQPIKILHHEKRGTIIKWELEELDLFEERILSYKVTAKLPIIGEFILPKGVVKYKKRRLGREYYTHSNSYHLKTDSE